MNSEKEVKKPQLNNEAVTDAEISETSKSGPSGPINTKSMEIVKLYSKLTDLMKLVGNSSGYLLGLTTISNGKLRHSLLTKDFKHVDMLRSVARHKELVVELLEKIEDDDGI